VTLVAATGRDVLALLTRLVELTEAEGPCLVAADAEAIERICDERAGVLAALAGRALPADAAPLLERFEALRAANERAATAQLTDLRRRLGRLDSSRTALTAYAPAPAARSTAIVEGEG
jgi:hypothetical protein